MAQNVASAIQAAGVPVDVVAQAADLSVPEMNARLSGAADFTSTDLVKVGGFLRIRESVFMEAAA